MLTVASLGVALGLSNCAQASLVAAWGLSCPEALVSWPEIEPVSLQWKADSQHWTTREVPKWIILKQATQVLVHLQCCTTLASSKAFQCLKGKPYNHQEVIPQLPHPQTLATMSPLSCSMDWPVLGISKKEKKHTLRGLLCLASFTEHNVSKIHSHCSVCSVLHSLARPSNIPVCRWTIFYPYPYPFTH